ncbi:MAG TPA: hypothetical protein VF463_10635 [Sphingobium sp.]
MAEPDAPVAPTGSDQSAWQAFDKAGLDFDIAALAAGRSCRDALARACRWHADRGMKVAC